MCICTLVQYYHNYLFSVPYTFHRTVVFMNHPMEIFRNPYYLIIITYYRKIALNFSLAAKRSLSDIYIMYYIIILYGWCLVGILTLFFCPRYLYLYHKLSSSVYCIVWPFVKTKYQIKSHKIVSESKWIVFQNVHWNLFKPSLFYAVNCRRRNYNNMSMENQFVDVRRRRFKKVLLYSKIFLNMARPMWLFRCWLV